jgi:hypothetical protein
MRAAPLRWGVSNLGGGLCGVPPTSLDAAGKDIVPCRRYPNAGVTKKRSGIR